MCPESFRARKSPVRHRDEHLTEEPMIASPETTMEHVVLVLFENRSFDNLLGRLYAPEKWMPSKG